MNILYIDSIFLINFVMDLFLLTLTVKSLKNTATFIRIFTGSLIGAAGYCLVLVFLQVPYPVKVMVGMIPVTVVMLKVGCNVKGVMQLCRGIGYLFTYAFFLGGFILFLRNQSPLFMKNELSLWLLALAGYIGFQICIWGISHYKKAAANYFCEVEMEGDTKPITVLGLVDSGNGLKDPVSGKAVAVLEEEVWNQMTWAKKEEKYKAIPFHSIGKDHGIMEGYEVNRIVVKTQSGTRELYELPVAVYKGRLSVKGEYRMILPPGWLM